MTPANYKLLNYVPYNLYFKGINVMVVMANISNQYIFDYFIDKQLKAIIKQGD
jgi:hypothetical protein